MNKKQLITILLCLFCAISFAQTNSTYAVKTVVIDAGHGGKDPGACGKISKEKNITLAIALKVGSLISGGCQDVKVIYTRNTDEFIELHKRADIANKAKADLFISIHVNANPNPEAYGTDTWTMGLAKNEANLKVAKMENDVISLESDATQYQGMSANDNEAIILYRLQQGAYCDNSLALAGMVQKQLQTLGRKDRSVHQAPFLVLWKTAMPSILIETGFITNPEEEIWLNSPENQAEMAYSIYQAFIEYKQYIERRTNGQIENTTTNKDVVKKQEQTTKPQPQKTQTEKTVQPAEKVQPKPVEKAQVQPQKPANNNDIFYGIQIGAGSEKLSSSPANFNGLEGVYYIEENGLYKYYYGKTTTYAEISELLKKAKEKYPSAFVVARDGNNNKLQVSEARKKTN
ncbi:MAG: N-acetylmuramoyl-L-alanine amidase [Bacteroidales bacterium]|nr:N-acetylmuramoyl-L-alanine amidase [Bacteroidales bacterium]